MSPSVNESVKVSVKERLARRAEPVRDYLAACLQGQGFPQALVEAMEYSLLAGGKRLRPVLCTSFCSLLGGDVQAALPFAAGFELIHTYSLIHDDLPAMDDDDLRRGRPSCHKQFDEATAILAGDGLLTEAFGLMCRPAKSGIPADRVLAAVSRAARGAGAAGMVGGQLLDMAYTGRSQPGEKGVPLDDLRAMHAMKTGALITGACVCGALLAGTDQAGLDTAETYGRHVGVAFQIVDDILDLVGDEKQLGKPVGSDLAQGKTTYPGLLGLDESRRLAREHADQAAGALDSLNGEDAVFLRDLAQYVVDRAS